MPYELSGDLLEVCTCKVLCPCWIGEDPDGGYCHSLNAWHVKRGQVDGVEVSGLTFATLCDIPGNVLKGNWRIVAFVDDQATKEQGEALQNVFLGKLGGPCADLGFSLRRNCSRRTCSYQGRSQRRQGTHYGWSRYRS